MFCWHCGCCSSPRTSPFVAAIIIGCGDDFGDFFVRRRGTLSGCAPHTHTHTQMCAPQLSDTVCAVAVAPAHRKVNLPQRHKLSERLLPPHHLVVVVVVVVEKALRAAATAAIVAECLLLGAFLELLLLLLQLEKTPLSTDDQTRASANRALLQISIPITARRTNMLCAVCAKAPWPEARSRRPLTRPSPAAAAAWSLHSSTINLLLLLLQLQLWPIFARFRTLSLSLSPLSIYLAALSAPRRATLAAWPGLLAPRAKCRAAAAVSGQCNSREDRGRLC